MYIVMWSSAKYGVDTQYMVHTSPLAYFSCLILVGCCTSLTLTQDKVVVFVLELILAFEEKKFFFLFTNYDDR